jgi:hypothetical protein
MQEKEIDPKLKYYTVIAIKRYLKNIESDKYGSKT